MQNHLQRFTSDMGNAGLSKKTIKQYRLDIKAFLAFSVKSPEVMEADDVRAWLEHLRKRNFSFSRYKQHLAALGFLFRRTLNRPEVVSFFKWPKEPYRLPIVLTAEEARRVLEAITEEPYSMLFRTIIATGLRISEACNLQIDNIESARGVIRVVGKSNREREVALTETLLTALRQYWMEYRPVKPWLFTGKKGNPITAQQAQKAFREAVQKLGLQKKATPHTLRHTYATLLLEQKTDVRTIQCLLGHKHLTSTEKYMHVNSKIIRQSPDVLKMLSS